MVNPNIPEDQSVDTRIATVAKQSRITRMVVKQNVQITLDDVIELQTATDEELLKGEKALLLSDIRGMKSITREARTRLAGEESIKLAAAQAVVVDSGFSKVIGNFLIGLNKTPYPTKLFTSEAKAREWLEGLPR